MPLKSGSSQKVIGDNIKELMSSSGQGPRPQKQAVAIALKQAGMGNQPKAPKMPMNSPVVAGPTDGAAGPASPRKPVNPLTKLVDKAKKPKNISQAYRARP